MLDTDPGHPGTLKATRDSLGIYCFIFCSSLEHMVALRSLGYLVVWNHAAASKSIQLAITLVQHPSD